MRLTKLLLILILLFYANASHATEKLFMPLATPRWTPAPTATPSNSDSGPEPSSKDGHWIYSYPNGNPESEGDLVAGKKEGIWKYWRDDNTECREMEFKRGLFTGKL